jgi:hypothetical protein
MESVITKVDTILCKEGIPIISQLINNATSYGIDRSLVERTIAWCSFVSRTARLSTDGRTKGDGWQATALERTSGVYIEVSDKKQLASIIGIAKDADLMLVLNTLCMILMRFKTDWREWQGFPVYDLFRNGKELSFTYVPIDVVYATRESEVWLG